MADEPVKPQKPASPPPPETPKDFYTFLRGLWKQVFQRLVGPVNLAGIERRLFQSLDMNLGYVFMLLSSCMIALLGLLMNSAAVVIGAMLLSPLMDPILGGALALAKLDREAGIRAAKGMAVSVVAVGIMVLLFMEVSPLKEITEQIELRTRPNLFDLFVAFFAAIAGTYILITGQSGSAVPGVAIAVALMPPLVTMFFAAAIGNWVMARGAGYLFFTNFATITFAAMMIFWLVGFRPEVPHKNLLVRVLSGQFLAFMVVMLAMAVPLSQTLIAVSQEANARKQVEAAVTATVLGSDANLGLAKLDNKLTPAGEHKIALALETPRYIPEDTVREWQEDIGLRLRAPVELRVRQISVMQSDPLEAMAALAPKQAAAVAPQPPPSPVEALSIVRERLRKGTERLITTMPASQDACREVTTHLPDEGPVEVTCWTQRPKVFSPAQAGTLRKMVEEAMGMPVTLLFKAQQTNWKVAAVLFENGRTDAAVEQLPCTAIAPPEGLSASYELMSAAPADTPWSLMRRRQESVRHLMGGCGVLSSSVVLSTSMNGGAALPPGAPARVDVWMDVTQAGD